MTLRGDVRRTHQIRRADVRSVVSEPINPEASLLDGHIGPDVIEEFLLRDDLAGALGKVDQDVEGPVAQGQHYTLSPQLLPLLESSKGPKRRFL